MSTILKNYTPDQLYELMKNKVIADDVGLTNYNPGSDTRAILEAVGLVASTIGFDFLEGTRQSIPLALYEGLNFGRNPATISTGFLRFYRRPIFYIVYSGADADVELDITATHLILTTSGTPADDVSIAFATYTTIDAVITQIDTFTNWDATKVLNTGDVSDLYQHVSKQVISNTNYLTFDDTVDIMPGTAPAVTLLTGLQAQVDEIIIQTTAASSIPAGDATSPAVAAESVQTGKDTEIDAQAINTIAGKGVLNTSVVGVEYVINDSAFAGGENEETDEERASRFQVYVQGLHGGTTRGIESDVLEITSIKSVTVQERTPVPGTNTIIADDGTGSLSLAQIDEIQKVIEGDPDDLNNFPGAGVAGINYNVEAPTVIPTDVIATVYRIGTISDENELLLAAQSAIERYINTRKQGDDTVRSEIIKRAKASHPAIYDFVMSTPVANVPAGLSEITRTGAGTGSSVQLTLVTFATTP